MDGFVHENADMHNVMQFYDDRGDDGVNTNPILHKLPCITT